MINKIKKHLDKNDKLLKHSLIIFIASLLTGFINYLYQLYMGRALGPEQYGILGALFSIVYMGMFSIGSINTVVSKLVSENMSKNKIGEIKSLFYFIGTRLFAIGVILSVFVIIFRDFIAGYLKLPGTSMVYILALVLLVTCLGPLFSGMLNGMQFFGWSGAAGFIGSLIKLTAGVLLVYYGLGVNGALLGLFLGILIPLALSLYPIKKIFTVPKIKISHSEIFKYAIPAIIIVTAVTLIVNIDLILVKHKFSAFDAGIYASASTLAKIIMFASGSLITVMLPKVSNGNGKSILRNTLFYVSLIGIILSLVYFVMPSFVINILFGKSYLPASPLIGLLGISIALFSITNVLVTYNLAVKRMGTVYFAIIALILEIFLINSVNSLSAVVNVVLAVNFVLLLSMLVYTKRDLFSNPVVNNA